jgi:hypothetical protein
MRLDSIVVLWRQPDTLALWGIPHGMRAGQSPRDLWEGRAIPDDLRRAAGHHGAMLPAPGPRDGWVWLGQPGWWGSLAREDRLAVEDFLGRLATAGLVPEGPGEWCRIII